jgi:hypothetical protein
LERSDEHSLSDFDSGHVVKSRWCLVCFRHPTCFRQGLRSWTLVVIVEGCVPTKLESKSCCKVCIPEGLEMPAPGRSAVAGGAGGAAARSTGAGGAGGQAAGSASAGGAGGAAAGAADSAGAAAGSGGPSQPPTAPPSFVVGGEEDQPEEEFSVDEGGLTDSEVEICMPCELDEARLGGDYVRLPVEGGGWLIFSKSKMTLDAHCGKHRTVTGRREGICKMDRTLRGQRVQTGGEVANFGSRWRSPAAFD